ncbi:MAG: hypothetical protein WB870_13315 [Gallionellaceae bacterium]
MMKPAMLISLMEQVAIRLGCKNPQPSRGLSRKPGDRSEGGGAGTTSRCPSFALAILLTFAGTAHAQEISSEMDALRSDFSNPEIPATEALIDQSGDFNYATIDQGTGGAGGNGNYAEIDQSGSSNQASVVQTGYANRARIDQPGSFNSVNATQSGSGNLLNVVQNGSGNSLDVVQNGSGNSIDLAQTWNESQIQASQTGDNNIIVGTSMAVSAALTEIGNSNSITVSPSYTGPALKINASNGMQITVQ